MSPGGSHIDPLSSPTHWTNTLYIPSFNWGNVGHVYQMRLIFAVNSGMHAAPPRQRSIAPCCKFHQQALNQDFTRRVIPTMQAFAVLLPNPGLNTWRYSVKLGPLQLSQGQTRWIRYGFTILQYAKSALSSRSGSILLAPLTKGS